MSSIPHVIRGDIEYILRRVDKRWDGIEVVRDRIQAWLDSHPEQPAMPQPDWSAAPPWAKAHYFNAYGYGCWSNTDEIEVTDEFHGGWKATTKVMHLMDYSGLMLENGIDWRATLQRRPEESPMP